MEETNQVSDQQPQVDSVEQVEQKRDAVAYETYRRTLSEAKKAKARAAEQEALIAKLQQEKMEAEGNKDALIDSLRKQKAEVESQLKESRDKFAYRSVSEQIKREALAQGCKKPDVLMQLLSEDDWNSLEVGEDYSVNGDDLKRVIESSKKRFEDIALFGKSSANVQDVVPTKVEPSKTRNVSEMSLEEKSRALAELL